MNIFYSLSGKAGIDRADEAKPSSERWCLFLAQPQENGGNGNMKNIVFLFYLGLLSLFLISCTVKKNVTRVVHANNMTIPRLFSAKSKIYLCTQYTVFYIENSEEKLREACGCKNSLLRLIEWEKKINSDTTSYGTNIIIIWDKDFITNYILPLIREEKDIEKIKYTLANSNDSTFKNIVDVNNKMIVNDKMYYYPINIKTCICIDRVNYEWFKSLVPQSSWIYKPDCFTDGKGTGVGLLIPLLENNERPRK